MSVSPRKHRTTLCLLSPIPIPGSLVGLPDVVSSLHYSDDRDTYNYGTIPRLPVTEHQLGPMLKRADEEGGGE